MKNVKITSLSTIFFVLWSVLYILNDMKVLSLSLVNAVPMSLVIIPISLFMRPATVWKEKENNICLLYLI